MNNNNFKEKFLKTKNLTLSYGPIKAIHNLNIEVKKGQIVGMLGANGAGKSTTLKGLMGLVSASEGSIFFKEQKICNLKTFERVRKGLSLSPEGRQVFSDLSVKENLAMATLYRKDPEQIIKDESYILELFPILKERYGQLAGTMSGGEQQMLAIARAYMSAPDLLLLDEPSLGVSPILTKKIFAAIKKLNEEQKLSIFLVEQNVEEVLKLADYIYIMECGQIVSSGIPKDMNNLDDIKKAYLGN